MKNKDLKLSILNLAGDLSQELIVYITKRGISLVDVESQEHQDCTHILTRDVHDFSSLQKTYKTIEKDIKFISLTAVDSPQNFILANGKLIIDEVWMKGPLGNFILDKFFQEYAGISMGDNYPKFEETGFFNISNPFSTGDYVDRMVSKAFESDFAALSIRTYFDHLLMYLTGLKNKGKVGLPIEVTYGSFDNVFGLQLHFFADKLTLSDVTSCLSSNISKKPEEHLLNVSVQSSDFFDFTYLTEVKKVVITGLWTKDERVKIESRGMMFTTLSSAATLANIPYEGLTSQLMDSSAVKDMSEKIFLPDAKAVEEVQIVSGEEVSESFAEKISSQMDMEQIKQIVKGSIEEEEIDKIIVSSDDEIDELVNLVKGSIDEEAEVMKISGSKLDVDEFAFRISADIEEKGKQKGSLTVKSLGQKLPDTIKTGLFDFAKGLGKKSEDLSEEDILVFKQDEVPKLIKSQIVISNNVPKQIREDLRLKLSEGLMLEFEEDSTDSVFSAVKSPEDEMRVKRLLKDTLKNSLETNFNLVEKENVTPVEKDMLVKSLSVSLNEDEDKIREIVKDQQQPDIATDQLLFGADFLDDKKLEKQLSASKVENDDLKKKMKTLLTEVKILKDGRQKLALIQAQAKLAAAQSTAAAKIPDQDMQMRKHFQERLAQEEILSQQEQKKLSSLMEREAKLIETVKQDEMKARRLQIEATQKESIFARELEKASRENKAKDLMLTKTKEGLQKLSEKKESEITALKTRIENMSQALNSGPTQGQVQQFRDIQKQNQNMAKMIDMYKNKVSSMVSNLETNKTDDGTSKDEVRRLQMLNNQFKNQVDVTKKELQKFQDKSAHDQSQISALRAEKIKLDGMIKKLSMEVHKDNSAVPANDSDFELKRVQGQLHVLETQFKDSTIKLREAELRLADAQRLSQRHVVQDDGSKKLAIVDANLKKITNDLLDSRNQANEMKKETNKLRQEKTSLQNQLDKLKKDTEKAAKNAVPNKPGSGSGGGKAA